MVGTATGRLEGKTALVSGASRGIGREIALGLSLEGARVIGVARSKVTLNDVGDEIRASGGEFLAVPADLSDVEAIPEVARSAWTWQGSIDVLVNAAGMIVRAGPLEIDQRSWDEVFGLNVRGAFFLSQALGARMLDGSGGAIVNIASVAGEVTTGASVVYSASKAALIHMTRVLAVNWAPKIRVNAVGPAYIETSLNKEWLAQPDNKKYVLDRTPLGRIGSPRDVVGGVMFLASDEAAYVTGHHLLVDGGWMAQ